MELQVFGTLYGSWLGIAVPAAFGAEGPEAYGAGLLIGGPGGLVGSRAMQRARPMSEGQARAISWGGIWVPGREADGVRCSDSGQTRSANRTSLRHGRIE